MQTVEIMDWGSFFFLLNLSDSNHQDRLSSLMIIVSYTYNHIMRLTGDMCQSQFEIIVFRSMGETINVLMALILVSRQRTCQNIDKNSKVDGNLRVRRITIFQE